MTARDARLALVERLERAGHIRTPAVRRAFAAVPRERFVPDWARRDGIDAVYTDRTLVTRRDEAGAPVSSSSQPSVMARMLERLHVEPGQRVLEIGTGTGYGAALLSRIVGRTGSVTSIDVDPAAAADARAALQKGGYAVRVLTGDGATRVDDATYDRIIVTASTADVPHAWYEQLADGGLITFPLRVNDAVAHPQALPVLRKHDGALRFVSGGAGPGFMNLRADGAAAARSYPTLTVARRHGTDTRGIVTLHGDGLAKLNDAAARRLLAISLAEPRRRPVRGRLGPAALSGLQFHLAITAREAFLVRFSPRSWTYGVFDPRGSLAFLATRAGVIGIDAYGTDTAATRLAALVSEWRECGCPPASQLRVDVHYGRAPAGKGIYRVRRAGCVVAFAWPKPD